MTAPAPLLVIDARPRGPRGLLASELLLGRPVLCHLAEQALAIGSRGRSACNPCPRKRSCVFARLDH